MVSYERIVKIQIVKKNCFFFLVVLLVLGCTSDDLVLKDTELQFTSQKWKLTKMTGSWVNSVSEGEEMEWQEYYIFHPDGSFLKSREQDGIINEASGTFEMVEFDNDDADYLSLKYVVGEELVGSCSGSDKKETLRYLSSTEMYNTWMACDGPGLYYVLEKD